jgi:hypothetical protein
MFTATPPAGFERDSSSAYGLSQLRIHLVGDGHNVDQQHTQVYFVQVVVQFVKCLAYRQKPAATSETLAAPYYFRNLLGTSIA